MAGIGDSWGTREELLHPRGPDGKWIRRGGVPKRAIAALLDFLGRFRPRTFQSDQQAAAYMRNVAAKKPGRFGGGRGYARLAADFGAANEDLRDGVIDDPSTKRFVDMMDQSAVELPDDVIVSRVVGPDAFGFTPQTANGTDSENDPGIRGLAGKLIADRGYSAGNVGTPLGSRPQGSVLIVHAVPKGTKVIIPARGEGDRSIFLDRGQPLRVTKVEPDGRGGWTMYVTAETEPGGREVPEPIGGHVGEGKPQDREARVRDAERIQTTREKAVSDQTRAQELEQQVQARAELGKTPSDKEIRARQEAQAQVAPPGTPPPRTEPVVGRVGGGPQGGAPAAPAPAAPTPGAPEAPAVPRRTVDIRTAVREAGVPSPSSGKQLQEWNSAYMGLKSGRLEPDEAVRGLDADIQHNMGLLDDITQRDGETAESRNLERNIQAQEALRDLIKREYGLEETPAPAPAKAAPAKEAVPGEPRTAIGLPKAVRPVKAQTRLSRREQEAEARNRAAAEAEAPAPAKIVKAPAAKKAAKKAAPTKAAAPTPELTPAQEDRIVERARGFSGPPRNDEERRILDQAAEISERRSNELAGRRRAGTATIEEAPARVFAKKAAPAKAPAKKAVPEAPGDDLDKMTKKELIDFANRPEIAAQISSSDTKDKIKEKIRRAQEIGPPEEGSQLDRDQRIRDLMNLDRRPTVAELRSFARENDVRVEPGRSLSRMSRGQLESTILNDIEPRFRRQQGYRPRQPELPAKKAAPRPRGGAPDPDVVRQQIISIPEDERFPFVEDTLQDLNLTQARTLARTLGVRGHGRSEKPEITKAIVDHFGGVGAPEAPTPVKKAVKAAVPEAAPGTAAGKITAGRLTPGMRILVDQDGHVTSRKTGSKVVTVDRVDRVELPGGRRSRTRLKITAKDENGNEVTVGAGQMVRGGVPENTISPSQTFIVAPETGAAPRARKVATPEARTFPPGQHSWSGHGGKDVTDEEEAEFVAYANEFKVHPREQEVLARIRSGSGVAGGMRGVHFGSVPDSRLELPDGRVDEIRAAVEDIFDRRQTGRYITLQTLREELGGRYSRAEVDRVLQVLNRSGDWYLVAESNQETLTPRGRLAAVVLGNQDKHALQVRRRMERLVPEGGVPSTPEAPEAEAARTRQAKIDRARNVGDLGTEIEQLVNEDATPTALRSRVETHVKRGKISETDAQGILDAIDRNDRDQIRVQAQQLMDREGVTSVERAGDMVPFDRTRHKATAGSIPDGAMVHIVRPGHESRIGDERVPTAKAIVEEATPEEVRGKELVPDGSVAGPRTRTPVDNAPRKRGLREAWHEAKIKKPGGPPGKQIDEIKEKLLAGDLTPEEGIRMLEAEIAFNKEDRTELEAHLRDADLTPKERREFEGRLADLDNGISAQEDTSKFLRLYFKDETPTRQEVIQLEVDPEAAKTLKEATPESLREAAKIEGLDPPKGETTDEIFQDVVKQLAAKELARRAAKKAPAKVAKKAPAKKAPAKKAAPPAVPPEKERVDARLLAEGIEGLDDNVIDQLQKALDGEAVPGSTKNPTPSRIAEWLEFRAQGLSNHTAIVHGNWARSTDPSDPDYDPEFAEQKRRAYEQGMAQSRALQELSDRVRVIRRRSFKKTAPAKKAAPEVQVRDDKIDDLQKRIIDNALTELQGAKSREKGDDSLEGLTMEELRRLIDQAGIERPKGRTKRVLRDAILDRFVGEQKPSSPGSRSSAEILAELNANWENPMSREDAAKIVAPLGRAQLMEMAKELKVPGASKKTMPQLRQEIVQATVGARLDSIATRGFRGARPGQGDVQGRPDLPTGGSGRDLGEELKVLARGTSREERSGMPGLLSQELIPNNWGALGTGGPVEFHDDGVIGQRLRQLRGDVFRDVDGEPLGDVIGKIATRGVRGDLTSEQVIREIEKVRDKFPRDSEVWDQLNRMAQELDAPPRDPLPLPDDTFPPITELMRRLSTVPIARGTNPRRSGGQRENEMDMLQQLVEQFNRGEISGLGFISDIREMQMNRHESQEGKFEITRFITEAVAELEKMYRDPETRALFRRRRGG